MKPFQPFINFIFVFHNWQFVLGFNNSFSWKEGSWGNCRNQVCGPGGTQERDVICSSSTDQTVPSSRCELLPMPDTSQTCFRVCQQHRYQYVWKVGDWSTCQPRLAYDKCQEPTGVERRDVTCVAKCGSIAPTDSICEYFHPRPAKERVCEQKCPRDCISTVNYGPFSHCDSCFVENRVRLKLVLAGPEYGGTECGQLIEKKRCPRRTDCDSRRRSTYHYKVGNWTECLPFRGHGQRGFRGFNAVLGHKHRTVGCINSQGTPIEDGHCATILKPNSSALCVLPRDCLVSHWTNWTSFSQSYQATQSPALLTRQRSVIQVPRGHGDLCPYLIDNRSPQFMETQDTCHMYKWIRGAWSRCRLLHDDDECGTGVQRRTVLCVRGADVVPVQDHHCAFRAPVHTRTCSVPCPQDCLVSPWSEWSLCLPEKCRIDRAKTRTGYRDRQRSVLAEGTDGGRTCAHVKEYQPCEYPSCYSWKSTPSGECTLRYPEMHCGQGYRNLSSVCLNNLFNEEVENSLCFDPRPAQTVPCHMPCANDCVVSQWSEWSLCSKTCGLGRVAGHKTRWRDALATPGPDGSLCPPVRMLIEKEPCNEFPCFTYHWMATEWSDCHVISGKCGAGRQFREVDCFRSSSEKVSGKRCQSEDAPVTSRNCSLDCPRDCLVSVYTDWSKCPVTCYSDGAPTPQQQRSRFVLEWPSTGGLPCPDLEEYRPCLNIPRCIQYSWSSADWSQCLFVSSAENCGIGYRAREVRCRNDRGDFLQEEICISELGIMPEMTTPCYVPCNQGQCQFSDWSEWSPCTKRCGGHRVRQRAMEGMTSRIADCYQTAQYPRDERKFCGCPTFNTELIGYWSHCVLDPSHLQFEPEPSERSIGQLVPNYENCGIGRRLQALICRSIDNFNASAPVCGSSEFDEEMCFIPCPRDCKMSDWTGWSQCVSEARCGLGRQTRYRYMMESSLDGGRDCPPMINGEQYQNRSCKISCDRYHWHSGYWSMCTPLTTSHTSSDRDTTCGPGLQSRIVKCVRRVQGQDEASTTGEEAEQPEFEDADLDMCDNLHRPTDLRQCQIPCPGECVVSEWSEWSACDKQCDTQNAQVRHRAVVRYPAPGGSQSCPHLEESTPCRRGDTCWQYHWDICNSTSCILEGGSSCGTGRMHRFRACIRTDDGIPVSDDYCTDLSNSDEGGFTAEAPCLVPCPVDCVVSTWSTWSQCSLTCGYGVQTRWRAIVIPANHGGRHCPEYLEQQKPCPYVECFRWQLSEWGPCEIETNACGFGVQRRNLTCIRHDGMISDTALCPQDIKNYLKVEMTCHLACPGDCKMSTWTVWGSCHRPCNAPDDTEGRQTRTRAILDYPQSGGEPCPSEVMESRPCVGGPCPIYKWSGNVWFGDRRHVWCQREDGLRVQGACREADKPPALKVCVPPCPSEYSYCRDTNRCDCSRGYIGTWSQDGSVLLSCKQRVVIHNLTNGVIKGDETNEALYLSDRGSNHFWIYTVISAACASLIFIVIAIYAVCRHTRKERAQIIEKESSKDLNLQTQQLTNSTNGMTLISNSKQTRLDEIS